MNIKIKVSRVIFISLLGTTTEKRDSTVKRSKIRAGGLFVFGQTQLRQIFQVGQLDNSPERLHFNALLHPSEAISHKDALKVVLAPCISNVIPRITFDQNPSFRKSRIHDRVCGKLRFDHQHRKKPNYPGQTQFFGSRISVRSGQGDKFGRIKKKFFNR
jgi:hypothetical protein